MQSAVIRIDLTRDAGKIDALVTAEQQSGRNVQTCWVADASFGPFDDHADVMRWLHKRIALWLLTSEAWVDVKSPLHAPPGD